MKEFKEYLEATKVDKEINENDLLTKHLVSRKLGNDKDLKFVITHLVNSVIISKSKLGIQKRNKLIDKINELYGMPKNLRTDIEKSIKSFKKKGLMKWVY